MDVSVIIPLYNEQECVELLYRAVTGALEGYPASYEILFVDDGSSDKTFDIARSISEVDSRLRIVKFRRNYGQTPAMMAGIHHARGQILVTMDGDLQNDPRDIPIFLDKLAEGYDLVVGWRHRRQDKLISRKIPSKIANWLIGKVTGVPIKDNGCSLKAYKAEIVKSVPLYSEMHRFIPAMLSLTGARIAEIKVRHHARQYGQSKYGLSRVYKVLLDLITIKMITSFATRLPYWFSGMAVAMLCVAALTATLSFVIYPQSPVVLFGISLVFWASALFLFSCGILGELMFRTSTADITKLPILTVEISE